MLFTVQFSPAFSYFILLPPNTFLSIGSQISSVYVIPSDVRPCLKPKQNEMQNCSMAKTLGEMAADVPRI